MSYPWNWVGKTVQTDFLTDLVKMNVSPGVNTNTGQWTQLTQCPVVASQ